MIFEFCLQYSNGFELQADLKASDHICKRLFIANNIFN